jgi:lipoyl(octanoyl) transferase
LTVSDKNRVLTIVRVGRSSYRACWALQRHLQEQRVAGAIGDLLLLTEHDPVITLGTTARECHLLASPDLLNSEGIDVVAVDRGGDVTFHGPGQLVGYPILNLTEHRQDLHWYLRQLEQVVIDALARWNLPATRVPGYTGVWVADGKVCAIGVNVRRWVTMHGFALNVTTDLQAFRHIVPCGISDRGVTSMHALLGYPVERRAVEDALLPAWEQAFQQSIQETTIRDLGVDSTTLQRQAAECL